MLVCSIRLADLTSSTFFSLVGPISQAASGAPLVQLSALEVLILEQTESRPWGRPQMAFCMRCIWAFGVSQKCA